MTKPTLTEEMLLEALRQVMDPEIDFNIVDLGLIYEIKIDAGRVTVRMTLTTPGCPMHESIALGARNALIRVPGVVDADVEIVWDPPWHPSMMSAEAQDRLSGRP